jgi:hypothetical protein
MVVIEKLRQYRGSFRDRGMRRKAIKLEIGDLVSALDDARGFCFTPDRDYKVLNICPIYEVLGPGNFHLQTVLLKLADDNGTIKEVSYKYFKY